jgi:hypothetical protein
VKEALLGRSRIRYMRTAIALLALSGSLRAEPPVTTLRTHALKGTYEDAAQYLHSCVDRYCPWPDAGPVPFVPPFVDRHIALETSRGWFIDPSRVEDGDHRFNMAYRTATGSFVILQFYEGETDEPGDSPFNLVGAVVCETRSAPPRCSRFITQTDWTAGGNRERLAPVSHEGEIVRIAGRRFRLVRAPDTAR